MRFWFCATFTVLATLIFAAVVIVVLSLPGNRTPTLDVEEVMTLQQVLP